MARSADESGVRSVRIALDVLEAVAFSGEEMGVTQIAERLKLTKGSVHRHLLTLVERGYLTQNQTTSRYAIGAKGRLLARLAPEADLARLAEGPMRELRDQCGHSVVLSSMSPRGALVMLTIAGTSAIEIGVRPGSELPYYASAQGKVMLAFAPRPVQQRALREHVRASRLTQRPTLRQLRRISRVLSGVATAPRLKKPCLASTRSPLPSSMTRRLVLPASPWSVQSSFFQQTHPLQF